MSTVSKEKELLLRAASLSKNPKIIFAIGEIKLNSKYIDILMYFPTEGEANVYLKHVQISLGSPRSIFYVVDIDISDGIVDDWDGRFALDKCVNKLK